MHYFMTSNKKNVTLDDLNKQNLLNYHHIQNSQYANSNKIEKCSPIQAYKSPENN